MTKFALVTQQQFNEITLSMTDAQRRACLNYITQCKGDPLSKWGYSAARIVDGDIEYIVIPGFTRDDLVTADDIKQVLKRAVTITC